MKPTKNKYFCNGCGRYKMLFESQSKANNFIKFNGETISEENGRAPVRSYYCEFCGGWHVTSNASSEIGERINEREHHFVDEAVRIVRRNELYKERFPIVLRQISETKSKLIAWNFEGVLNLIDNCYQELEELKKLAPTKIGQLVTHQHKVEVFRNVYNRRDELLNLSEEEVSKWISVHPNSMEEKIIVQMLKKK